jgi:hypothetical protein
MPTCTIKNQLHILKTHPAIYSIKPLKTILCVLFLLMSRSVGAQSLPLPNAFAHNDYRHRRPLADALGEGYTNVEADVFLMDHELIVAHVNPFFKNYRTLERLYLKPLFQRISTNGGEVYRGYDKPLILMIDIKTGSKSTYMALKPLLEKYRPMLSIYDHGITTPGAVTVVLSGHKPYQLIKSEGKRLAFIDEDLRRTYKDTAAVNVYTMASCKYSKLLKWNGTGAIPTMEEDTLLAYVKMAHKYGKKVRLWASPENETVWRELLKCGVDLINTDKLATLKDFLTSYNASYAAAARSKAAPITVGILGSK